MRPSIPRPILALLCALAALSTLAGGCGTPGGGEGARRGLSAEEIAALPLDAQMPLIPAVRSGTLENGMRYFIRRNAEPAGRAELRYVVDIGSLVEAEDERGLAHFMEHMLFNGTERFPGMEAVLFLQSTGMMVGPDVNAYTGYDETVCVLKIPTDRPDTLPTAFDIMRDWSDAVSLDPREVDAERGVIVEERRMRNLSASGRVSERIRQAYLADSRYAKRSPIGSVDVIRNAPAERLQSFYRAWYRPENLAIVAVGDFDPAEVEEMIRERFTSLRNDTPPRPRPPAEVPRNPEPRIEILADPEQPVTQVTVGWKRPAGDLTRVGSYKDYLAYQIFDLILNLRLLEASQEPGSPMIQASVGRSLLVRSLEVWSASALADEGQAPAALDVMLREIERVRRYGVTQAELDRAKSDVATSYARAAAEERNTPSASLADELVRHVTTDEPVPGIAAEQAMAERFLPMISLEDMNREARRLGTENRVVIALVPEKPGLVPPAEAALASVLEQVAVAEIEPYEDTLAGEELMTRVPEPAAIVERRAIPSIDATELVLENGARVLYKRTGLREQEVLFAASSPGGASLVSDADYAEARLAGRVAAESGVRSFSRLDLLKVLAGRELFVVPSIDDYYEEMRGEARAADLPALFQLVHLFFTDPRRDDAALDRVRVEYVTRLENLRSVPEAELEEAVQNALYGDTVRAGRLPLDEVEALDAERLFSIYRERFADASDFVFMFVGSFDPAQLEDLARRYLGTLPAVRRPESYQDRLREPPAQVVKRTLTRGKENRSQVRLVFEGELPEVTPQTHMLATLLEQSLGEALQSELREVRGAVYGVLCRVDAYEVPDPTYRATVEFTTDPQRVPELIGVVFQEIERLRERGPSSITLALVRESERRSRQEDMGTNGFWLGVLEREAKIANYDPSEELRFEEQFEELTPADVRSFARTVLRNDRYVQVVLDPEREPVAER